MEVEVVKEKEATIPTDFLKRPQVEGKYRVDRCHAVDNAGTRTKGDSEGMSWRASAYVKTLTHHLNGTKITAREKLILFVLADSHNDDYDCAWPGVRKAAAQSLTSTSRFMDLIKGMETKGTLRIERSDGKSNRYFFPGLFRPSEQSTKPLFRKSEHTVPTRSEHTVPIAVGTEPPLNRHEESEPPIVPVGTWLCFAEMRKKIRKPLTDRASELIRIELLKLKDRGFDPVTVLEQSIRNSWQDVFPIREERQNVNGGRLSKEQQRAENSQRAIENVTGHRSGLADALRSGVQRGNNRGTDPAVSGDAKGHPALNPPSRFYPSG